MTGNTIARILLDKEITDWEKDVSKHQIQRGIQQYCLKQLNMVT